MRWCDKPIQKNNTILIPYKNKFTADFSPTKIENWFRGYVILQNMDYNFSEVGNIVAHSSAGTYYGLIKATNGNPNIIWKTITTYWDQHITNWWMLLFLVTNFASKIRFYQLKAAPQTSM